MKCAAFPILLLALSLFPLAARATEFESDLRAFCSNGSRIVGSQGYESTIDYLKQEIGKLPGVQLQVHEFPITVPITESATLSIGSKVEKIYPFWPAQVRLNATPLGGIKGKLIYVGNCTFDQIKPKSLRGQIAVIESTAGQSWTQAAYFGARAILVLGSKDDNHVDFRFHDLSVPVNVPRFYIPPGALADQLRAGAITDDVTLDAKVDWRQVAGKNLYALVLPERQIPDGWDRSSPPGALVYSVPFDASGLVPDLAVGASQAVQTAAGLALLRDAANHRLNRPVMVAFTGGDSIQFLATREMFMALADVPKMWEDPLATVADERMPIEADLKRLEELRADPTKVDVSNDRDAIDRITKIIETDGALEQDDLFRLRMMRPEDQTADQKARQRELEQRQITMNRVRFAFQQKPQELTGPLPVQYIDEAIARVKRLLAQNQARHDQLQRRVELYRWLANALGKDPNPSDRANNSRVIEMVVALDLSDKGNRVGPMYWGQFQRTSNISQIQEYRDWFSRLERAYNEKKPEAQWFTPIHPRFDIEPLNGASPQSWLCAPLALTTEMCQAWGVPGFTLCTLDDLRLHRDTPADTLDAIDVKAIEPQLDGVRDLMRHAWNDVKFKGQVELKWQHGGFEGQVVSAAPGRPVPDLPREGFLASYSYVEKIKKIPPLRLLPWTLGVRRTELQPCDAEGRYRFEGLPRLNPDLQLFAAQVYHVENSTGDVTACGDLGKQTEGISIFADIKQDVTPIRNLVFNCNEFSLVGIYDPRFLQDLGEVLLLDARRNAEPQRFSYSLSRQFMAGFVEPDMRAYLLFRYGRVGNRLVLLNMEENDGKRKDVISLADGFSIDQLNNLGPLSVVTSRDFVRTDDVRLEEYRAAGVSSSLLNDLHQKASEQIRAGQIALDKNDGASLVRNANGAWANEARVYQAAQDMANDVVYAAIFLLLLCVPFSFCMERLLIGTPNVYKQIAGTCGIFAIMAIALWSFHPAFKISTSPLIIILAFAIIFMSIVVISVVYGKFDTELKRIRSGRGTAMGADFASASVFMSAILLGLANMRRRKFRTTLTSITVVLITFAVLCFTSASRYLDTVTLPTGYPTPHPAVMLRQRGFRPMPPVIVDTLNAVLGKRQIVQRWWNANPADPKDQIHVISGDGKVFASAGVLGVTAGENQIAQVVGQSKWDRLVRGDRNIIYFSREIADQLGVKEGDSVAVAGFQLQVAGVFDANQFDSKVTMLSGDPVSPLRYSTGMLDAGGRVMTDTSAVESLDLDADTSASELSNAYEHLSATQFVVVPAEISRMLPNGTLRSVEIPLKDEAEVKKVSDELSRRLSLALFAGYNDGVKMVAASNLTSVSGAGQVAIPLAIAGLIIFNTMMGSIAERKREIHVYTSLGLAPMHVGALFLAEALTYGLIGTVFGYVIGQGVGTLLLKLGWLGSVTLNYSGSSAIVTMGMILLIVLLSALVPAHLASKLAAPSIERSWKVPLPKNDEIMAQLPFTINKTAAEGALAYLAEFFGAHQEGSIGKFSAGKVETFAFDDEKQQTSRGLKTVVWLTPFDLGVRQHFMLLIHPGEFPDIYEVQVVLQRLSGDDSSWYRMNRTFLTELRKQFLQWRSLSPQKMLEYVDESRKIFAAPKPVA